MTPAFTLHNSGGIVSLDGPGGRYDAPVHVWEAALGLTSVELLARWDDVYQWPNRADEEDVAQFRADFIALPHAAQAVMVAEWEGDTFTPPKQ